MNYQEKLVIFLDMARKLNRNPLTCNVVWCLCVESSDP